MILLNLETEQHIQSDKVKQAENQLKDDDLQGWNDIALSWFSACLTLSD
jgi:hypothetical protein